jgi:hypothetical protein
MTLSPMRHCEEYSTRQSMTFNVLCSIKKDGLPRFARNDVLCNASLRGVFDAAIHDFTLSLQYQKKWIAALRSQ